MRFRTVRYDFEIEVLIRLLWRGVNVREVDIDVLYPEGSERVSHFHKFKDNARISLLNTVLVTISLLRSNRDPAQLALAVGSEFLSAALRSWLSYYVGDRCGACVAVKCRRGLIGSQISLPFFVPLLVIASVSLGKHLIGVPDAQGMVSHFYQYLAGSLLLGVLLGVCVGSVVFAVTRLARVKGKKSNWSGKSRGGVLGTGFLKLVLKYCGLRAGYFCLYFIIPYFWLFAPNARRGIDEYYALLRPELSLAERQKAVMRLFFTFGKILMDRVYQGYRAGSNSKRDPRECIIFSMVHERGED